MITKFWPRVQQQHITICIALYIRLRLIIQTMQKRINIKISKDQTAAAGIITYTYYQVINLHERCRHVRRESGSKKKSWNYFNLHNLTKMLDFHVIYLGDDNVRSRELKKILSFK